MLGSSAVEKCCGEMLWRSSVGEVVLARSAVGKCCREVLWRRVLQRSVVKKYYEGVL